MYPRVALSCVVVVAAFACSKAEVEPAPKPVVAAPPVAAPVAAPVSCVEAPEVIDALFGKEVEACAAANPWTSGPAHPDNPGKPEACRPLLERLMALKPPACITSPERADDFGARIVQNSLAARALARIEGVDDGRHQAQMLAVDSLLALADGNGGNLIVLEVGAWLKAIDDERPVAPAVKAWRSTVASRLPSPRHSLEVELGFSRKMFAPESVAKMTADGKLSAEMKDAFFSGSVGAIKVLERLACADWKSCLGELSQLEQEYTVKAEGADALTETTSLTAQQRATVEARGTLGIVSAYRMVIQKQADVFALANQPPAPL